MEFTPLLTTSPQTMVVDAARVRQEPNPTRLLADFRSGNQRHVIAARHARRACLRLPGRPARPGRGPGAAGRFPRASRPYQGAANIVVVNDTDILEDRFWVRVQDFFGQQVATPFSGNGALVANLVDTLGGSDALISLRSRGESLGPSNWSRISAATPMPSTARPNASSPRSWKQPSGSCASCARARLPAPAASATRTRA